MARRTITLPPLTPRRRRLRYLARRALWLLLAAAVGAGLVAADGRGLFGRAPQPDRLKYHDRQFTVTRVVDGDTLHINCPDGNRDETVVRLLGVDTPETVRPDTPVQYYGPEASRHAKSLAQGKTVTIRLDPARMRDRYNRLLAYVILPDGKDLALELVANGYGYCDPRFRHPLERQFRRAQNDARANLRGLWQGVTEDDLPDYYRGTLKLSRRPASAPGRR